MEEIEEVIENYDRDKRSLAVQLYNQMFRELDILNSEILMLSTSDNRRLELIAKMKDMAELMQALNYAACQFENEKISDLADDCPASPSYGGLAGVEGNDGPEALTAWLKLHFPHTWPH